MTDLGAFEFIKLAIYFASYLYFPAAAVLIWLALGRAGVVKWGAVGCFVIISLFAYGRFVEPRILIAPEHDVRLDRCFADAGDFRVAVASDLHIGLFGNAMPIDRIAARINRIDPDLVFLPGDFIYFLNPAHFEAAFGAFALIEAPVFGVLGNHDLGLPGPDLSGGLQKSLPDLGVQLIDDQARQVAFQGKAVELAGLSDDWAGRQNLDLLESRPAIPRIALTHNAASVRIFPPAATVDLLVAGHTHGGQINLPIITCAFTTMCGKRRYGVSRASQSYPGYDARLQPNEEQFNARQDTLIFTTSGTGMVGLPMRFRVPPRIDVLNVSWRGCGRK